MVEPQEQPDPEKEKHPRMGWASARKWSARVLKVLIATVALVLTIQVLLLPLVVRKAVSLALAGIGIENVQFTVRNASFFSTDLHNVILSPGQPGRIGAITVDYTLASLLKGRVNAVRLIGAEVQVSFQDGKLDLGPLKIKRSQDGGKSLPFDCVELRASTLALIWEQHRLWVPAEGTIRNQPGDDLALDFAVRLQGTQAQLTGNLSSDATKVDLSLEAANLDTGALSAAVPTKLSLYVPALGRGNLNLKARFTQDQIGRKLSATASANKLRLGGEVLGHRVAATDLGFLAHATFDATFALSDINAELSASRIIIDGELARNVTLKAFTTGSQLSADFLAEGNYWKIRSLQLLAPFPLPAQGDLTVKAGFGIDGSMPQWLVTTLLGRGLDVSALGMATADGSATLTVPLSRPADWRAAASVHASLKSGDLRMLGSGTTLRGLGGSLILEGTASAKGAQAKLLPGTEFWVSEVQSLQVPAEFRKTDQARPLVEVALSDAPADFSLDLADEARPWQLNARSLTVTLPPVAVNAGKGRLSAGDLSATLRLAAKACADAVTIHALDGSQIAVQSIAGGTEDQPLKVEPWKLLLAASAEPLVRVEPADQGFATRVTFSAHAAEAVSATLGAVSAKIGKLDLSGAASMTVGGAAIETRIGLDQTTVSRGSELAITGIVADIPITLGAADGRAGQFRIDSVRYGQTKLPPIVGEAALHDMVARFTARTRLLKDVGELDASGRIDMTTLNGELTARAPRFKIEDTNAIATLVPAVQGNQITGTFALDAAVKLIGGRPAPLITLEMQDAGVANQKAKRSARGISGKVVLDSFSPLTTQGGHEIRVAEAKVGQLSFTNGVFTFRVEDVDKYHLEGMKFDWADGSLYVQSFRLDLDEPSIPLNISADRLGLSKVLSAFIEGTVAGQGVLYGRLPVRVHWPQKRVAGLMRTQWSNPQVELDEGFLYATPDGVRLQFGEPETLIGSALDAGKIAPKDRRDLIVAMEDVSATVLKLDLLRLDGPFEPVVARVHIAGKGHKNDREIGGFTINFRGLEEALNHGLLLQGALGQLQEQLEKHAN